MDKPIPEAVEVLAKFYESKPGYGVTAECLRLGHVAGVMPTREVLELIGALTAAQQPVQEGGGEVCPNCGAPCTKHHVSEDGVQYRAYRYAPPSAPVGVDASTLQGAAKALLDARSQIGARRPDDEDDAEWWDELTTLAEALTQQPAQAAPGVPDGCVLVLRSRIQGLADVLDADGDEWAVATEMREWLATPPGDDAAGGGYG